MNNQINKSYCCQHCSKLIPQGEERKNCQYIFSSQGYNRSVDVDGWNSRINYPRIERVKMYLYCPPCSQGVDEHNNKLLDPNNPQHAILNPGVKLERSRVVEDFDNVLREKTLGEKLEDDWQQKLKEGKPWEHPNNKVLK